MKDRWIQLYWRVLNSGARVLALLLAGASLVAAVGIATQGRSDMDPGLRWGLVTLMIVIFLISLLALRTSSRRP